MSQLSLIDDGSFEDWFFAEDPPSAKRGVYQPRWYQDECHEAILEALQDNRSCLAVLATGLGKLSILCQLARDWTDGDVLVIAHRDELIDQAVARLELITGEQVEIEQGQWRSGRGRIVVASAQTVSRIDRLERLGKDRFGLILPDEFHHYVSKTWRRPLDYFDAKVCGFTATPDRGDAKALGKICDVVAYVYDIADGIEDGWLVPLIGKTIEAQEIDLSRVSVSKGDLDLGELDEAMLKAAEHICQETLRICPDRSGIQFWPGVRSAELACYKMNELRPGCCAWVSGDRKLFPTERRKAIFDDFRSGRVPWLSNCQIAGEGVDIPQASCVVFARPTKSRSLAAQQAGRGTRVLPGVIDSMPQRHFAAERRAAIAASAKRDCLLLDFVGNAGRHKGLLITPTDILGGNYSEAEIKAAKKLAEREGGGDVAAQLKKARDELRRMAAEHTARVKSCIENWDPFGFLGIDVDEEKYAQFGAQPLTEKQFAALKRMGFPADQLDTMTKRQGMTLFNKMDKRRAKGLCSMGKANQLRMRGIDPTNVTEANAAKAMEYLAATGWGRGTNPVELNAIAYGTRDAGSDG